MCDEERIYFYDHANCLRAVPLGWTNIASPDPYIVIAEGKSIFRANDLLELARLIATLKG